jgi:hypothetical protein
MTTQILNVMYASETAFALRLALGPLCDWSQKLADWRRRKTDSDGTMPRLMPCAGPDGEIRMLYDLADIQAFVEAYKRFDSNARRSVAPEKMQLEVVIPAPVCRLIKPLSV